MSLIITKKFKCAKALDAVARNAASDELNVGDKIWITQYGRNYPYTITKKWKEGWTVWYKAKNDKSGKEEIVAGAFANALDSAAADAKDSISDKEREYTRLYELAQKNITFHAAKGDSAKVAEWKRKADEYKRLAQEAENAAEARNTKDSRAADAQFKIGDKVRRGKQTGIVRGIEKEPYIEVKFTDQPVTVFVHESEIVADNSRAADACGTDAKFQKGDKVRVWQYPVYGKLGEVVEATNGSMEYTVNVEGKDYPRIDYRRIVKVSNTAGDAAEFHVGQRVRAKDPRWTGYQGHALGNGIYTVKKVDWDGTVKLNGFLDVWISPSALVEANDACGKGEDAKNDFANRIMPLVRKIADAQKIIEGVLGEAEEIGFEAAHGEFPDSTFAKKSANQLEAACYEAVTALRKVKMIAIL